VASQDERYRAARRKLIARLIGSGTQILQHIIVLVLAIVVIVGLATCLGGGGGGAPSAQDVDEGSAGYLARSACEDAVEAELPAPGDATYTGQSDDVNGHQGDTWSVASSGTVTSAGAGYDYVCAVSVSADSTEATVVTLDPR
jgi:hypothetical protein